MMTHFVIGNAAECLPQLIRCELVFCDFYEKVDEGLECYCAVVLIQLVIDGFQIFVLIGTYQHR